MAFSHPLPRTFFVPLICWLLLLFSWACDDREVLAPVDLSEDYAYFPLTLDRPQFFALDSIVIFRTTGGAIYDTTRLEVREALVEQFVAADGTETFRGERWDRRLPNGPWRFRQTYTVSRSETVAVRSEDNLSFNKLVFPIRTGQRWDGHTAFDDRTPVFAIGGEPVRIFEGWDYFYQQPSDSIAVGADGLRFADAVVVEQDSTDGLIRTTTAYEIYAPGIGRVERYINLQETQCEDCCNRVDTQRCIELPWSEKKEKGFILRETFLR